LDCLEMPEKPLDVLAQQIVACAACEDWDERDLLELMRSAWPYRNLAREEFDDVLRMLAEGFSTKRGRRGALIHHDAVNHRVRGRRGARLVALTSGGAIPDNADYRVVLEPSETFIGTVNEDFAIESMAGDIFQLGNASWKILRLNSGQVRVADAHGQPPSIPFWLGEAPGRTTELSRAVSDLRVELEKTVEEPLNSGTTDEKSNRVAQEADASCDHRAKRAVADSLVAATGISESGARQLADYFVATYKALGVIPSQKKIVLERFFDESGGMQLVIHSPFGIRMNRAWGLALRKRFCRSFNFELQAAATDDAIVLSLGTQHSFPLDEVFRYLNSKTVRDLLVQALLDAPMFPIRWRWNAARALALPRQRGGRKIPAPLQRMESENLLAAVFPDQLACLENIAGDREIPEHPLVRQTIEDCLTEAMDIEGLVALLQKIEQGEVQCLARDLPEPSPLAHEILHAKPYAFLDNAPLEERRTQAVYTRRASESSAADALGILDAAAIEKVCAQAWPRAQNADELHEALLLAGVMTDEEISRVAAASPDANGARPLGCSDGEALRPVHENPGSSSQFSFGQPESCAPWLELLANEKRAGRLAHARAFWVAAERLPLVKAVFPEAGVEPQLTPPEAELNQKWERSDAVRELVRGRMEIIGPITAQELSKFFTLPQKEIDAALLALEAEGLVLRGKFHPGTPEVEWCDRRLLARIHRLTINRLRAEIQPVSIAEFQRFLLAWQRVAPEHRAEGPDGLEAVLELLDGYELPAAAWEPDVLSLRVNDYSPQWLDQLCFTGRIGWGRLTSPQNRNGRPSVPVRSSPVSFFLRAHLPDWLLLCAEPVSAEHSPDTKSVFETLAQNGAMFFGELVKQTGLLPSRVEQALAELVAQGWVTSDSFEGLRALLVPQEKRVPFADLERKRRHKAVTSVEYAGRWALFRKPLTALSPSDAERENERASRDDAVETFARGLLRRYGLVFRRLLERESFKVSWYELGRIYRRLEARGEIRGGHFVGGVSGEQFALPEAIGLLRSIRKAPAQGELIAISGADPLNLAGILTPGPRLTAIAANRILLRDGVPVAALEAGKAMMLNGEFSAPDRLIERALCVGHMAASLRPYYA